MNRYIDADALMRYGAENQIIYSEDIDNAPSIDIVRCKECKHWHKKGELTYCDKIDYGYGYKADDFCSCGERKTEPQTERSE